MSDMRGQAPVQHQKDIMMERCEEIKFVEVVEDEYLGNVNLHRLHPYVKYVASKTIPTQFVTNFPSRLSMHHPNLFFYVKRAHSSNLNAHQFNIFFEYNYQSLESMISRRREEEWHYPETELWTIIKEVCSGMKFLMDQGIHHGELKKTTVFFDDEYLLYRVYDNQLLNSDKYYSFHVNNQTVLVDNGTPPPEFSSYDYIQFKNTYKVDMWNFGLIMLECATLQNVVDQIYSQGQLRIDAMRALLQSLNGKYSQQFINALLLMLDPDPRNRFDWQILSKHLRAEPLANQSPPYQTEATQLHPSRSLENLHEIIVGAQPVSEKVVANSSNGVGGMPAQLFPSHLSTQLNVTAHTKMLSHSPAMQIATRVDSADPSDFSATTKKNVFESSPFQFPNNINSATLPLPPSKSVVQQQPQNWGDEKDKQQGSSTSQMFNQRLMILNQKIQETIIKSQKKTKKLTQGDI